ncbi:sugar ABC transporter ATP-binding protein [Hamadaea sp. NPDC050747]|uniref:sugar ABC transporter ATP-binding protein n=1 Tax=Hamadaea sp. NPDC050747 TaxID=3155789 RepID=UPI0033CCB04D
MRLTDPARPGEPAGPGGLRVEGIAKRFGPVQALTGVSLDFPAGCVTALLGENGAGKSTLVRVIDGQHVPDDGRILLDGVPVRLRSPGDARRAGIRVIPQEPDIVPHVSVAENVYLGSLPRHAGRLVDRARLRRRVRDDLASIGFAHLIDPSALGRDLTPAQRQLVEILRALTTDARVLAFDEPTSSLSEHETEALFALIRRLAADGRSIIYVSHRLAEIFRIADRVAVLRDGALVGVQGVEQLDEAAVVRMMVGRDLGAMFAREHVFTEQTVLAAEHVSTDAVTDVSLRVRAGEVVALAGLVGAGRSELCRALAGDLPIHSGTVSVDGRPVVLRRPADAVRAGIAYAPEERKAQALLLRRSVRDNVTLAVLRRLSRLRFVRRSAEQALAAGYVHRLRVRTPSLDQEVGKLSGGNQQKVVLARWLARRPRVLLLDEPTRGVDVGAKAEIYRLIAELAEDGMAVVVVSSELPEVLGLADRIVVLQRGRVTGELDRSDATEESILALAMMSEGADA